MDKFRHSLALENTRLWCLVEQTFLRSSIQGRFLVSTWQTAYGQRLWKHGYPAIGVMGVLDMFFVFFLGHGKSPFL